jgi:DNA polymerase V
MELPIFSINYKSGIGSPNAVGESNLDINQYLVKNSQKTFLMKVYGDATAKIKNGDILIVDSSIKPKSKDIIIARANKEFYIKRYVKKANRVFLEDESAEHSSEEYDSKKGVHIWGVVTHVVHNTRSYF